MPGIDHFGILAPFYDRLFHPAAPNKLIALAGLPAYGRLLDAGGGTGRIAEQLTSCIGQIIVADQSFKMLRQASIKQHLQPVNSNTAAFPFPKECFARIIVVDAWHHLDGQAAAAGELLRVLERGGRILIQEPDIRQRLGKLVAMVEYALGMHSRFMAADQIAALFSSESTRQQVIMDGAIAYVVIDKF